MSRVLRRAGRVSARARGRRRGAPSAAVDAGAKPAARPAASEDATPRDAEAFERDARAVWHVVVPSIPRVMFVTNDGVLAFDGFVGDGSSTNGL